MDAREARFCRTCIIFTRGVNYSYQSRITGELADWSSHPTPNTGRGETLKLGPENLNSTLVF